MCFSDLISFHINKITRSNNIHYCYQFWEIVYYNIVRFNIFLGHYFIFLQGLVWLVYKTITDKY